MNKISRDIERIQWAFKNFTQTLVSIIEGEQIKNLMEKVSKVPEEAAKVKENAGSEID